MATIPPPVFPAGVATDAQLKVANNLVATALTVSLAPGDMLLWVNSIDGFPPNCLVSVESEIIAISQVMTTPSPALVVATGGRGFDGTLAANHSAGAKVSMFIDAWHHNALSSEVQAIEAALGPNLVNVGKSPFLISTDYIFAPQSPGGTLNVGANVILLTPVPEGVNGSDPSHYLYISGGTGTAENVLITGGTAVSGSPSGTVIVTCANTHSGAWTIQSSTAGIREAIIAAPAQAKIIIPAGNYLIDCLVIDKCVWVQGCGEQITMLTPRLGTCTTLISVHPTALQYPIHVSDMSLILDGFAIEGMRVDFVTRGEFNNLRIQGGTYGIRLGITAQVAWCHFHDIAVLHPSNTAFWVNGDAAAAGGPGASENWYDDLDLQQDSTSPMQCGFAIIRTVNATDGGNHYMKRVRVTRVATGTLTNGFLFSSAIANAVFNVEMLDCVADAISGNALQMVNCAEVKSTLGWFASTGSDATGAAISFNSGYNFSFVMTKIASQNASAFAYSNQPTNIVLIRNIYLEIAQFVHNLPATGYPLGLHFIEDSVSSITNYANDFGLLQAAQGATLNPSSNIDMMGGNLRFYDQAASTQVFLHNSAGDLQALTGSFAIMFEVSQAGNLELAGSLVVNNTAQISAGAGSPNSVVTGSPGDLYLSTSGGAGTTLWVKESGTNSNTGWVGK